MSKAAAAPRRPTPAPKPTTNPNPPARAAGQQAPRPGVAGMQRDQEQARRQQVPPRTSESAGERRAARASAIAGADFPGGTIKVQATQAGYYDHARRRPGDVFAIDATAYDADVPGEKGKIKHRKGEIIAFSKRWMIRVDDDARESLTSSNEVLRQHHDELMSGRHGQAIQTPLEDGIDDGDDPLGD